MPFQPVRLLVITDDRRGHTERVVPRLKQLLEHRAFIVDTWKVRDGPVDVAPYKGLVWGSPVFGLGLSGVGPTPELTRFVLDELPDLQGRKVAVFCVYETRPGLTLDRMKGLAFEKGADLVAAQAYPFWSPRRDEHVLPTECMVRIR